ncbi:hypothetical protein HHK36_003014 [Tetracentron sinense]|uniref:RRM domain-containing protein n=1 Tax=Tetracentron sinense TaxID=13715 RepID=A0A834ZS13_TETSI|nr:hypothetical protein HHK36_003014 [Tetracentron sinense]
MRTRKAETPKSSATKKTPPVRKSAVKTPPNPPEAVVESTTPKSAETKSPSATGVKQAKNSAATTPATPKTAQPKVEEASASADAAQAKTETKSVPVTKSVTKKTPGKTKSHTAAKAATKVKVEESPKKAEPDVGEFLKKEEPVLQTVGESPKKEEPLIAKVVGSRGKEVIVLIEEEGVEVELEEAPKAVEDSKEPESDLLSMEEDPEEDPEGHDDEPEVDEHDADEGMEYGENEGFEEPGEEECAEDDVSEPEEGAGGLEEEDMEMSVLAKERKMKKEQEIFIGGLDRDAVEEDVKKAFENIGEIVEVRLHRNPLTNKNKGFAFVKFADKEQATRALLELKNPLIRGKRCGTAPSEDNDTLFLGNICNTWTKEAIKQKLKEYGVEGVENITLVPDAQHEGLSRGFAFIEFSCHADAMLAYKRLQNPDVIFGHAERTVKVAFAEPLREPDPEVMAQVKSVFVDGLPPHWDEDRVKEHFKGYGEIEQIVLARNMSTAKRKDFGFVDFTTHEAAVACIETVNNTELGDGKSKTKVKARLSNPLPKTQAVKGGMRGGFRIGRPGGGTFTRFGRGIGRGGRPFNHSNFHSGRGFYPRGRGRTGRFAFANEDNLESPFSEFRGRRPFGGRGGRWGSFRGGNQASGGAATSSRPNLDRPRYGASDRGRGKHIQSRRQPFSAEEDFSRPFVGRHFDDPYLYSDIGHGTKRPFSMMDRDSGYLEPSRLRPRFDYSDPAVSSRGTHYRDSYGAASDLYSYDYYGSDYGADAYSSLYGADRSFGGGYYY